MKIKITVILVALMISLNSLSALALFAAEAENADLNNTVDSILSTSSQFIKNTSTPKPQNKQTVYQNEIDEMVFKVMRNTQKDSVSFGFITDLHYDQNEELSKNSIHRQLSALVQIANQTSIDFIVLGGDLYSGSIIEDSKEGVKELLLEMLEPLEKSKKPVLILKGNHDDNSYYNLYDPAIPLTEEKVLNDDEYYRFTNERFQERVNGVHNYFYYDLDDKNTRIICINASDYPFTKNEDGTLLYAGSNYYGYSEEQLNWLVNTALSDKNKKYIILSHIGTDMFQVNGRDELHIIMKSLNEKTTYMGAGASRDFSGYQGLDLFCFGHMHADKIFKSDIIGGAVAISTGSAIIDNNPANEEETAHGYDRALGRTYGGYSECLFDVIISKMDDVMCLRFGAGEDRRIIKERVLQNEESAYHGWEKESGIWFFYKDGEKQTGWLLDGISRYYLDANVDGAMRTGWLQQDSNWYYLSDSGAMVTGTYTIDGKVGSFDSSGIWLGYQ